ncbi:NAC domain-containing protein 60 isoform X1 [Capsella rubella]|uniref:NAC domain-containing protein 60 isoform X1 n=1 Tax=Capsella rubella TaxID=81985 RepID=UPI000CD5393C|nr:NAC domain-containing protein 60 isoform X1 [Capsella rubella]
MAAAAVEPAVTTMFPGFKFSPTDIELITYYLKRKIDGLERSVEIIPEVEIYNFEPWDLPDKSIVKSDSEWFFFCARGKKYPHGSQNRRATKMGYWKATGKERNVKSGSEVIGTKRTLVFHIGRAPKGGRTEWLMHEYCMIGVSLVNYFRDALVICRLRRNTEFQGATIQKSPQPNTLPEKHVNTQNDAISESISDWENMVDFYLSSESGQELLSEIAESSQSSQNPQVPSEEDFYADILRDEIVKLDDPAVSGNTLINVPRLQAESNTTRVLPLPNMVDIQMQSLLQKLPLQNDTGEENNISMSNCFIGIYSIKSINRARWDVVAWVLVMIAVLVFYLV